MTVPVGRFHNRAEPFPIPERLRHAGVPDHLVAHLRKWIFNALQGGGGGLLAIELEIPLSPDQLRSNAHAAQALASAPRSDLLRIVNSILIHDGPFPLPYSEPVKARLREQLTNMLSRGSSVWQAGPGRTGLIRRVDETVAAVASKGSDGR